MSLSLIKYINLCSFRGFFCVFFCILNQTHISWYAFVWEFFILYSSFISELL